MIRNRAALQAILLSVFCAGAPLATAQTGQSPEHGSAGAPRRSHPAKSPKQTQEQVLIELLTEKYDALETKVKTQLDQMQQKLDDRDHQLQQAVAAAQAAADKAMQQSRDAQQILGENSQAVSTLQSTVSDLRLASASVVDTIQSDQKAVQNQINHPDTLHYKGIELKPGGFLAAETVWRRRGIGGDINTQFTGVPFAGQAAGELSEFNASGRQSRFTLLADGKLSGASIRGYYEADFLSAGVSSNDNQSNSYTLRQRQVWAQAQLNSGLTFTGGQMWSLATEYKEGLTNTREATPLVIDAQYNAGFSWERQYGFRVVKVFNKKFWLAGSVEEAQTLNIGGHNLPPLLYQQAGNGGGLYNGTANYSYNRMPDLVAKIAYEPGIGHYELFAIGRFFRDRVYPDLCWSASGVSPISGSSCAKVTTFPTAVTAQGAYNSRADGIGIGANARVSLFKKKLDVGAHFLGGDGMGRYGDSTLADVTAHPNGSLVPLQSGSALGTVEWHPMPRWDIYGYYGGDYVQRAYYLNPAGKLTGYGAPTNVTTGCNTEVPPTASANGGGNVPGSAAACTADNRNVQEGSAGYWYRFYKGPAGTLQTGFQFSYVVRNTWLGVGGAPKAIDDMWFTSFRYILP